MTVSRALNHPEKVAQDTCDKVKAAIELLGYVPYLAANTLQRKRGALKNIVFLN